MSPTKTRNGMMTTSNQDYVNLLYSDSESDPPDLKLPPLKGKKPRKWVKILNPNLKIIPVLFVLFVYLDVLDCIIFFLL